MALYPVQANERDPMGFLKASSGFTGGEGGLLVRITSQGVTSPTLHTDSHAVVDYVDSSGTDYSAKVYGLLDEQQVRPETLLGSFLPGNSTPVGLGPATWLSSGRLTIWNNTGWFLTDNYALQVSSTSQTGDGYGEPVNVLPSAYLHATNADATGGTKRGTLCDTQSAALLSVGTATTRVRYMGMVLNTDDYLVGLVQPAPYTGMFKESPKILLFQE